MDCGGRSRGVLGVAKEISRKRDAAGRPYCVCGHAFGTHIWVRPSQGGTALQCGMFTCDCYDYRPKNLSESEYQRGGHASTDTKRPGGRSSVAEGSNALAGVLARPLPPGCHVARSDRHPVKLGRRGLASEDSTPLLDLPEEEFESFFETLLREECE